MVRFCTVVLLTVIGLYCLGARIVERATPSVYAKDDVSAASENKIARTGYVGDAACLPCHKEKSLSYRRTAHFLTSQPANEDSILGSFKDGSNILMIADPKDTSVNPRLYFRMDKKNDGYYETAVAERGAQKLTRSERIDVVIGSGVRGQTYLYWHGNQLYELPVSYWTDGHQWINSPGYTDGTANFARRADPRCLECHTTYIRALSPDPQMNLYDKASLVMGISCETCHGPGAAHVALERSATARQSSSTTPAILNPARFDRERQIDQCALCHNGTARQELMPAFSYRPGEPLEQYFTPNPLAVTEQPDVHGNQVGLLMRSRCYLSSSSMTCSTCHDVHAPERSVADYSNRCLACHRWQSCDVSKKMGIRITHNCIDCHMPLEQTNAIVSVTANKTLRTSIRSHWIKIYPGTEATSIK
jgi:hypothetical protein